MTSASRYADAPVWELLQHARERGAALGVVLSRVPPAHRTELVAHFNAMLDANGIQAEHRFVIPETGIVDGYLPDDIFQPIRDWLNEHVQQEDRRVAVLSKTMSGVLDTFKTRVPRLAAHVDAQVALRSRLGREAEVAYAAALAEFDEATADGRLLAGEVLARWQDYASSGDLGAALRGKRAVGGRRGGKRARTEATTSRYAALETALRDALRGLVVSVADRAAERVTRVWKDSPGGAALLAGAEASRARDVRAIAEFESAFGSAAPAGGAAGSARRPGTFDRSSPELALRVSRAVSAWQDQLMRILQSEVAQRPGARAVRDVAPLSVVMLVAMLTESGPAGAPAAVRGGPVSGAPRRPAAASGRRRGGQRKGRDSGGAQGSAGLSGRRSGVRGADRPGPAGPAAAGRPAAGRGAAALRRRHRLRRAGRRGGRGPAVPGRVLARGGPVSELASEPVSAVHLRTRPTSAGEEGS